MQSLKTGLTKYLIRHEVAFTDITIDDDTLTISVGMKKSQIPLQTINAAFKDISLYVKAQLESVVVHTVDGVVVENNKLLLISAFEVDN